MAPVGTSLLEDAESHLRRAVAAGPDLGAGLSALAASAAAVDRFFATAPDEAHAGHRDRVGMLDDAQAMLLAEGFLPRLEAAGVSPMEPDELAHADLAAWFADHVLPLLAPVAVDAGHPLPRLPDGAPCLVVQTDADAGPLPAAPFHVVLACYVPRFLPLPLVPRRVARLEDLVRAHVDMWLPGHTPRAWAVLRVTRRAGTSPFAGAPVRLQHGSRLAGDVRDRVAATLGLRPEALYAQDGWMGLADLEGLARLIAR